MFWGDHGQQFSLPGQLDKSEMAGIGGCIPHGRPAFHLLAPVFDAVGFVVEELLIVDGAVAGPDSVGDCENRGFPTRSRCRLR